jgi:addiction module RelB/DinJ family antitoxin
MDEALKNDFNSMCNDMGLTMTAAFTVFAKTVVNRQKLPFEISRGIPSCVTAEVEEVDDNYYELIRRIEVLGEYGAAIAGALSRYANSQKIDYNDSENPINKAYKETWSLKNKLLRCETHEELSEIKAQFDNLKQKVLEVNPNAIF